MHATQVLDNYLSKMCQGIHQKRWNVLMMMVEALMIGKKLSVTGLGRTVVGDSYEKHQIKKADRLIGNPYLNRERYAIYSALAKLAIDRCQQPVIHVDWSDLTTDRELHVKGVGDKCKSLSFVTDPLTPFVTDPFNSARDLDCLCPCYEPPTRFSHAMAF